MLKPMLKPMLRGSVLLAAVLMLAPPAAAETAEQSEAAIRSALEGWTKAFNAGDAGAVCELFAPDLVSTYQGQPERGYEALCALLLKSVADTSRSFRYSLDLKEIIVSGDLAAVRLTWTLEVDSKSGSAKETIVEPGLDIFRRQPDGRWRIARFLAYANAP